ncbi:MgtC/SapB family protein [Chryseobacterium sp. BIGb0232]|uniref:MgtC/SapB family protein n=1 Tax=Chryseobacterium sp. BIGb0232 TaxID=2940598 RepID=UPI000F468C6F|nr:MgtC/SapB family protein [Chryseobacterium sp. BIGb0232]MCS4305648.1 putative Mg2+ transporter-C (MgtC) family protein [Chryseobacterium sp. BIGb0232]ROS09642.1 putative Mg2+ transporter-C (MgtC) family protein [Chryseobacterium nakagawai]
MNLLDDILPILFSVIVGGIIGIEREYQLKSAGLRTMILVTLGSCIFTMLSQNLGGSGSPDRIAANIITGIGFVGAGVIFKEDNRVSGLTTAVTIWICAALGMTIGAGYYQEATIGSLVVFLLLIMFKYVQDVIDRISTRYIYQITLTYEDGIMEKYENIFKENGLKSIRGKQVRSGEKYTAIWRVQGAKRNHEVCTKALLNDPGIDEFKF